MCMNMFISTIFINNLCLCDCHRVYVYNYIFIEGHKKEATTHASHHFITTKIKSEDNL